MIPLDRLASNRFFTGLSQTDLATVAGFMTSQAYTKDAVIFYEGDPGKALHFVLDGTISIAKEAADGSLTVLTTIDKHDLLGEGALIDDVKRSATAIAQTPATLITLDRSGFEALSRDHPAVAIEVIRRVARVIRQRLRKTSAILVDALPH